jgi:very-short-patch-repair endonuclease
MTPEQEESWKRDFYATNFGRYGALLLHYYWMREDMEYLKHSLKYYHEDCESPPEMYLYDAAKRQGIDLIPQYPVLGVSGKQYFVDFAFLKSGMQTIVIEVNSRSHHKNEEEDIKRIIDIENNGMYALAFKGSKCNDEPDSCATEIKVRLKSKGYLA